jgi:Trk K+ transport system NAD-binding subunit
VLAEADSALRVAVLAAVVLVAFCALVLSFGYRNPDGSHIGPLHAVYFSLATITTVGFGDYSFSRQSEGMVWFGIFMIISGALTFTTLVALITNLLVGRRIAGSLGRTEAARMHGHVLVIGLGDVGVRVVQGLLAAGREVVVLERDDNNRHAEQVRALGVPIVLGDATVEVTLLAAGLARARAVAVLTSNDMVNIEAGLAVRSALGEHSATVPVVLRVFDRQLGNTVRESLGMRFVRSTAELAAPWFLGAALGLDVLGSFSIAREHLLLGGLTIAAGGGLEGVAMGELSSRTRVIALERVTGVLEYPPRRDTRFSAGDRAFIMGPPDDVLGVLRRQS